MKAQLLKGDFGWGVDTLSSSSGKRVGAALRGFGHLLLVVRDDGSSERAVKECTCVCGADDCDKGCLCDCESDGTCVESGEGNE
jgi:hypothetical protein